MEKFNVYQKTGEFVPKVAIFANQEMESGKPNPYAIIDDEPSYDPYSETNTAVRSGNVEQVTKVVTIPVSPVYQTLVVEPNEVIYTELCACDAVWWGYCCLSFWFASIAGCVTNRPSIIDVLKVLIA